MPKLLTLTNPYRDNQQPKYNDNDYLYPTDVSRLWELAARGVNRCKDKTVIFCGLCRDVQDTIERNITYIDLIGNYFQSYIILVYESDSKDSTVDKLYEMSESYPIVYKSEKLNLPRYSNDERERTRILSYCRNWYMEYLRATKLESDYVVVVDLDNNGWSLPGFFSSFGYDDWDMIGANGIQHGQYYDTFPLRIQGWEDYYFRGVENKQAKVARHLVFSKNDGIKPVLSCFGGLAAYRFEAIMSGYYGEFDGSEHVYLHRQMVENGYDKIYINPQMVLLR